VKLRIIAGRYQLLELLGEGGMATVYKASDTHLQRIVAIKLLRPQHAIDPGFVNRFHREARAAAALCHPNIVAVYDLGQDEDDHFIVLEYVEGETLKQLLQREAPLRPDRVAQIGIQVARALEYAHRRNLVHRDIKPQNILITADGQAKVTDFGIAAAWGVPPLTPTGTVLGTPHYLSPEQAHGQKQVTRASDIYSTGVVLYEMATGRPPFQADSALAVARMHLENRPPSPRSVNPGLPQRLDTIILRALEKSPERRFRSAVDLERALSEFESLLNGYTEQNVWPQSPSEPHEPTPGKGVGRGWKGLKPSVTAFQMLFPGLLAVAALLLFLLSAYAAAQGYNLERSAQLGATAQAISASSTARSLEKAAAGIAEMEATASTRAQMLATLETQAAATAQAVDLAAKSIEARATEIAIAESTATAMVQIPSFNATAQAMVIASKKVVSIDQGRLPHHRNRVSAETMKENLVFQVYAQNFVASVRFNNPYDPSESAWDYGLGFRGEGTDDGYRLYLNSDGEWYFEIANEGGPRPFYRLKSGKAEKFHRAWDQHNDLAIYVENDELLLFINEEYVDTLDVSHRSRSGKIWVGTGFTEKHRVPGAYTEYQDFVVRVLP
jgi:hypothetical protein